MRHMKDTDVIDEFVAYLEKNGHPGLKVERRPEIENRESADIDAIAGPFAIEHTSIDTLPNQRRNNARFMKVIGDLENELNPLPFNLEVSIEYDAITKGQDWPAIKQALKGWINQDVPRINDGSHLIGGIPGIPFKLNVHKELCSPGRLFSKRNIPDDCTLPSRIKELFDKKAEKLTKYQESGKITILLIESYDWALMNEQKMVAAIRNAYRDGLPAGVKKFWYAPNTSIDAPIRFKDITADLLTKDYLTKKSLWEEIENG